MVDDNTTGEKIIDLALSSGLRVYFDFVYCCIKLPRGSIIAKINMWDTRDVVVYSRLFREIRSDKIDEFISLLKAIMASGVDQRWPGGYLVSRKFMPYGSVVELEDESGIVDTQDLRCNRLYPKAEAVRIVLQYRAYRYYAATPADPALGNDMTIDEKYEYIHKLG